MEDNQPELETLIAKLRDVFPFPKEKDWDKGYDTNKKDGWHDAGILSDPKSCLEIMIGVCEGINNDQIVDKQKLLLGLLDYFEDVVHYITCDKEQLVEDYLMYAKENNGKVYCGKEVLDLIKFMKRYRGITDHTTPEFIIKRFNESKG